MEGIRTGKATSIDYKNEMVKILYPDKDGAVTKALPYLSMNGEYKMPKKGEHVLVLHLSNGAEAGVVLGPYWNEAVNSELTGEDIYRKEFSNTAGKAYMQHQNGKLEMCADTICFRDSSREITLEEIENRLKKLEIKAGI